MAPKQIELVHRKEKELKVCEAMSGGAEEVESVEVFFQIWQASWDTHVNMSTLYHRVTIPNLTPW